MAPARSSAQRSDTSSITTRIDGSWRGSWHTVQGSAVSTLPQARHTTMRSRAVRMASDSGPSSCSRFLIRWSAARRAERGPSPGSRARSWIRRSISGPATVWAMRNVRVPVSEQLQPRRERQALGDLLHAGLRRALGLLARVVDGGDQKILDDLLLVRIEQRGVERNGFHRALGRHRHPDHAASGAALDLERLKLGLRIRKFLLHGLGLL